MFGGLRLLFLFLISCLLMIGTIAMAGDDSAGTAPTGPPKAKVAPVEDTLHGTQDRRFLSLSRKLRDPGNTSVRDQQLAYTRSVLDPFQDATRSKSASPLC